VTEQEAKRLTRYFPEGVVARVSSWSGDGSWEIAIRRDEGRLYWSDYDALLRAVAFLRVRLDAGVGDLRLLKENYEYPEDEMSLDDPETAWAILAQLHHALTYVQGHTRKPEWFPVSADIFSRALATSEKQP